MKLYRIGYTNTTTKEECVWWLGTQADAKAKHKELCEEHERFNVDTPLPVEIPTDKPGLLSWLNKNCNTDNG